jgi:endonuclease YncB( thermonuclease family)
MGNICYIKKCCALKKKIKNNNNNLSKSTDEIPIFTFNGETYNAKIVSVYDGDTVKAVFEFNNKLYKFSIRMNGYDSPELRTKNLHEKANAQKAKHQLQHKILNKIVTLKCGKFDKYGRILGDIYYNNKHINSWMIENGYGYPYDGGKKRKYPY